MLSTLHKSDKKFLCIFFGSKYALSYKVFLDLESFFGHCLQKFNMVYNTVYATTQAVFKTKFNLLSDLYTVYFLSVRTSLES